MSSRRLIRLAVFFALGLLFAFVLSDVLGLRASETGVISPKGWHGISHGSHTHYVPDDWAGSEATGRLWDRMWFHTLQGQRVRWRRRS